VRLAEPLLTSREITKKRHFGDNSHPIAAQNYCCAARQATEFLPCRGEVTLNPEPGFPLRTATFSLLCIAIPHAGAAQTLTTLQSFNGRDGSKSFAGLVQGTNEKLYGTTYFGGSKNSGEVFEVTSGGTLATLYSFCSKSSCTDGEYTYTTPVQGTDGNFYGTTYSGGANGNGAVFKISPTGTLTTRHSFGGTDGAVPLAGLVQGTNGDLYGTTSIGGSKGDGVVFKITPSVHAA
jgi:uncharacterized repeat protein (TIGR03803 family)